MPTSKELLAMADYLEISPCEATTTEHGAISYAIEAMLDAAAMLRKIAEEREWRSMDTAPEDAKILLRTTTRVGDHQVYLDNGGEHFDAVQTGYWDDGFDGGKDAPLATRPAQWITEKIGTPTGWQPLPTVEPSK